VGRRLVASNDDLVQPGLDDEKQHGGEDRRRGGALPVTSALSADRVGPASGI